MFKNNDLLIDKGLVMSTSGLMSIVDNLNWIKEKLLQN